MALAAFTLSAAVTHASAQVVPPSQDVAGRSQAEWSSVWWQVMGTPPAPVNPIADGNGEDGWIGDQGSVFFLAGSSGGAVKRGLTVRSDQYLFFPLVNAFFGQDDASQTEEFMRADLDSFISATSSLRCEVDGVVVPVDLFTQRLLSPPGFFPMDLPEDNIFGAPAGVYNSVADGYHVMLAPLSPGFHSVFFGGTVTDSPYGSVEILSYYSLEVIPAPATPALLAVGAWGFARRRR